MAFPAYHPGQTRIVEFLLALQSLPRHEIYAGLPPEDPSEPYQTMTLWPLEEEAGYWQMFPTYFQDEIQVWLALYRLRNLNSAMARLTALKVCNCARLSALLYMLPSNNEHPDLEKRPNEGPNRLGSNLIAAAQWILPSQEGHFVYQECKRFESEPEWRNIWCMMHWREWKHQFAFVAGDERFAAKYREVAQRSYNQMLVYEEENPKDQ